MRLDTKRELIRKWRGGCLNTRQVYMLLESLIEEPWPMKECPECHGEAMFEKEVRVPKGKRKIPVSCPTCHGKGSVFMRPID